MTSLHQIDAWPVPSVAAAVVRRGQEVDSRGDVRQRFRLASISKLLAAYAIMVGVQEEAVTLDDDVGPPGATLRHLLAHASGLGFESTDPVRAEPEQRRIYSNYGIELAAAHLAAQTGIPFAAYLSEAVFEPLGMAASALEGSPAHAVYSNVADLTRFAVELHAPRLLEPQTLSEMTSVQYPGLAGFVPGVARFDPCDWGLGFELNFGRSRHWAGRSPSRRAFGHFGGAGTFLVADPAVELAVICLTNREFDQWALQVWPPLVDAVLKEHGLVES